MIVFGGSFLVPSILFAVAHGLERPVRRLLKVEDWLAITNLAAAVPRLSISVAALAVSLSMMVAVSVMIGSFRETVIYWVGQTLQADLFVSPGARQAGGPEQTLSAGVVDTIAGSPEVAAVDRFRSIEVPYGDTRVRVGGGDFAVRLEHGTLLFKAPADARDAMRRAIGQDAVVVSESFVIKQHVDVGGDVLAADGPRRRPVQGCRRVLRLLERPRRAGDGPGHVRSPLRRQRGQRPERLSAPGHRTRSRAPAAPDARRRDPPRPHQHERIAAHGGPAHLRQHVRDHVCARDHRHPVAILGVSGTLLTLILEREREFTILRLIGTGRRQIRRIVVGEAVLISAVSQAVGLVVGLLLSLVLIYVINVQSFGWTIQFHLPAAFLIQASILMVLATALAGIYPARRAQQLGTYSAQRDA